jgi:hypothetical protein
LFWRGVETTNQMTLGNSHWSELLLCFVACCLDRWPEILYQPERVQKPAICWWKSDFVCDGGTKFVCFRTLKTSLYAIIWSIYHITSLYHILLSYYQFTISHVSLLNKQSLPLIYFCTCFLPSSAIAIWNQALPFHVPAAHRAGRVAAAAVADLLLGHLAAQGAGLWMQGFVWWIMNKDQANCYILVNLLVMRFLSQTFSTEKCFKSSFSCSHWNHWNKSRAVCEPRLMDFWPMLLQPPHIFYITISSDAGIQLILKPLSIFHWQATFGQHAIKSIFRCVGCCKMCDCQHSERWFAGCL